MDESNRWYLSIAVGTLVLVVAAIHLLHPSHGGHALVVYASVGQLGDPRPLFFTLGSFALVFGVVLAVNGFAGRTLYLGGIVVTLAFLVGYAAWHTVLEHGAFWPHLESRSVHGGNPIAIVLQHLLGDVFALIAAIAEVVLLGGLLQLYLDGGSEKSE